MLTKLLKYEIKATARILVPLYIALIIFTLLNKFIFNNIVRLGANPIFYDYWDIIGFCIMFIYIFIIAAVAIMTFVIIIQRFNKNLLNDEGYLMNTLPVHTWENIASKLIVAFMWSVISLIIGIVSIMVLIINKEILQEIPSIILELQLIKEGIYLQIGWKMHAISILFFICIILQNICGILLIYASIAMGHLANKHKKSMAFCGFIAISTAMNTISSLVTIPIFKHFNYLFTVNIDIFDNAYNVAMADYFLVCSGVGIVMDIIFIAIFFWLTNFIIQKKLNIE